MRFFESDDDLVKRTLIICFSILFAFFLFFNTVTRLNHENQQTRQDKITACKTLKDETKRRDCLGGPQTNTISNYAK